MSVVSTGSTLDLLLASTLSPPPVAFSPVQAHSPSDGAGRVLHRDGTEPQHLFLTLSASGHPWSWLTACTPFGRSATRACSQPEVEQARRAMTRWACGSCLSKETRTRADQGEWSCRKIHSAPSPLGAAALRLAWPIVRVRVRIGICSGTESPSAEAAPTRLDWCPKPNPTWESSRPSDGSIVR
jgi:hypothetical protein